MQNNVHVKIMVYSYSQFSREIWKKGGECNYPWNIISIPVTTSKENVLGGTLWGKHPGGHPLGKTSWGAPFGENSVYYGLYIIVQYSLTCNMILLLLFTAALPVGVGANTVSDDDDDGDSINIIIAVVVTFSGTATLFLIVLVVIAVVVKCRSNRPKKTNLAATNGKWT